MIFLISSQMELLFASSLLKLVRMGGKNFRTPLLSLHTHLDWTYGQSLSVRDLCSQRA